MKLAGTCTCDHLFDDARDTYQCPHCDQLEYWSELTDLCPECQSANDLWWGDDPEDIGPYCRECGWTDQS